jgi:hypothetical protein
VQVDGEHFVPPGWRQTLATTLQFAMWGIVILLFTGDRIFNAVGIPPPEFYRQLQENQVQLLPCRNRLMRFHRRLCLSPLLT